MIASGRTKRSDDSYSYSVTGIPTSFSFCFKVSCLNVQDDSLMSDIIFYLYSKNLEPNLICCSPSPSRLKAISSLQQRVVNGKDSPRYEWRVDDFLRGETVDIHRDTCSHVTVSYLLTTASAPCTPRPNHCPNNIQNQNLNTQNCTLKFFPVLSFVPVLSPPYQSGHK